MAPATSSSAAAPPVAMDVDGEGETKTPEEKVVEEVFYPKFEIAQLRARYLRDRSPAVLAELMKYVKEERMLPFYKKFCEEANVKIEDKLVKEMEKEVEEKVKAFDEKLKDAEENLGDVEVKSAILDKADYFNKTGDQEKAFEFYEKAMTKTVGGGYRLDNILTRLRIALFNDDQEQIKKMLALGQEEMKKGGDWERKNKLKVYEGVFKVMTGDFEAAANLFLAGVATFTATEILSFQDFVLLFVQDFELVSVSVSTTLLVFCHDAKIKIDSISKGVSVRVLFIGSCNSSTSSCKETKVKRPKLQVFYTVLCSLIGLTRADLKKKVIGSPEILSVVHERKHMKEFLNAFYNCDYFNWSRELVHIIDHVKDDRYFQPNLMKISRHLRLNAYRQFITSYKSVTMKLMADTFGVSEQFIDKEIYTFISQGRLKNCKIDKIANVIETIDNVKDEKTLLYKDILKDGDELLNKMQKLAAAIDR
ncbi:unnamed protein product [Amoebophrya sp. A120]|nr:unnamed protein product [Amoebophrya sp. A120]|eukprot:GSA120T00013624001.1